MLQNIDARLGRLERQLGRARRASMRDNGIGAWWAMDSPIVFGIRFWSTGCLEYVVPNDVSVVLDSVGVSGV